MKRIITLMMGLFVFSIVAIAQEPESEKESNWSVSGFFQQNLNQVSFTNWAAGGENSFSSTSLARIDANYKSGRYSWENYADLSYGIIKIKDTPMRKNTDKIEIFSKLGREINQNFSYTGLMNFQSQFDKGFKFPNDSVVVSRFMAPAYLTIALGFDYKPFDFLSVFVSPTTGKFTFVTDEVLSAAGAFGVEPGKKVNPEFGALMRINFNKEVVQNVNVNSRITLFNNYTDSDASNRKNTDVDWVTTINMPINRFLTASVGFHLLYDHDIKIPKLDADGVPMYSRPTTQFKQQLGLGLMFKF